MLLIRRTNIQQRVSLEGPATLRVLTVGNACGVISFAEILSLSFTDPHLVHAASETASKNGDDDNLERRA